MISVPKLDYKALQITMPSEMVDKKTTEETWEDKVGDIDNSIERFIGEIPNVKGIVVDEQKVDLDDLAKAIKEVQRLLSRTFHLKKKEGSNG